MPKAYTNAFMRGENMETFQEMELPQALLDTLQKMQFTTPTPIQAEAIPPALKGQDVLGSAQTGTGKTAAFGIPLVAHLLSNHVGSALVMTPTRELAAQVLRHIQDILGNQTPIQTALLIGGDSMYTQLKKLRRNPRIVVGTPGRINDHLRRGSLNLEETDFLVLDETDRMLDMGFSIQIEDVLRHMKEERQTLLFSATLPKNIVSLTKRYLNNPVRVSVSPTSSPAANVEQETVQISKKEKYPRLLAELEKREGSVLVFINTKHGTQNMADDLSDEGYTVEAIHGDLRQRKRDRVIADFRRKKYRILVATDVAARGLDIPHIEHVINYDLPQCEEDYIHRIGRTGRAGAEGKALNFVSPSDQRKWRAIENLLDPERAASRPQHNDSNRSSRGNNNPRRRSNDRSQGNDRQARSDSRYKPGGNRKGGKPSSKRGNSGRFTSKRG